MSGLRVRIAGSAFLLASCAPVVTVQPDGTVARHYLGYVKVIAPTAADASYGTRSVDVTTVGVRVENGLSVGYIHDKVISVPIDCQLVLMVRTRQQLQQALSTLKDLQGEEICVAQRR